jgi:hypothetical protein
MYHAAGRVKPRNVDAHAFRELPEPCLLSGNAPDMLVLDFEVK